ncbi:MAG: glycine oxidase ThiO [Candidatus Acidiferrales bacterium]
MKTWDVVIVGGGVIGASAAFELAAEKLRVAILDRQLPGQEASWAAGGMLSPAPHSPQDISLVPFAKESLGLYPEFIGALEEASGRSAGFARPGALEIFLAPHGEVERDKMVAEHRRLGLAAEPVSLEDARKFESAISPSARAAAWLPEECTVEPRMLMDAVLEAARQRGVEIRADCRVTSLLCERGRCVGVVAGGEKIAAGHVVVAAGCYSGLIGLADEITREPAHADGFKHYAPTRPVRGQIVALKSPENVHLRRVLRSPRGYLVPQHDGRILAGSTLEEAGFQKHVTAAGVRKILAGALDMMPALEEAEIVETWAGLRPGTPDDLPIIGPTEIEGLFAATGHFRNGILLAPATAGLVREWITRGQAARYGERGKFSPLRFRRSGAAAGRF